MNRLFTTLAVVVAMVLTNTAKAQSLSSLLNSSIVKNAVSTVVGDALVSTATVAGQWNFSGIAVEFESEETSNTITGIALASTIETKLNEMCTEYGITGTDYYYIFGSDNTFSCNIEGESVSGTYSLDSDNGTITLNHEVLEDINLGSITANISVIISDMTLMFRADKLLEIFTGITSSIDNETLAALTAIAQSYDGLLLGFELSKQ